MRPYNITIAWVDFDPTNSDDIYEVTVWNANATAIITTWRITGDKLGSSITLYMSKE